MIATTWAGFQAHYNKLLQRRGWSFFWRVWLEVVAFSYGTVWLLSRFFRFRPRTDLDAYGNVALVIMVVIVGPAIETLIFQGAPIGIMRLSNAPRFWQGFASVALFGATHFIIGVPTGIGAGLIGGGYFALTYLKFRDVSWGAAFLMTTLVHGAYNVVGVTGVIASR